MSNFSERLRELRNSRKLSQQNLADELKISKSSVNMYERGEREPGIETLENIADYYKNRGYENLADEIMHNRIPRAIFGNMNYFFVNNYDFDEVLSQMKELDLFTKLSKFEGDSKFKLKIKLFLLSPKNYYKIWKKLKNSID